MFLWSWVEITSHMKVVLTALFMHMRLLVLSVWQLVTVISEGKDRGAWFLRALNLSIISRNKYVQYLIKAAVVITVISILFPHGCLCQLWSNYWNEQTSTFTPTGKRWPQGSQSKLCSELVAAGVAWLWQCTCVVGATVTVYLDNSQGGQAGSER